MKETLGEGNKALKRKSMQLHAKFAPYMASSHSLSHDGKYKRNWVGLCNHVKCGINNGHSAFSIVFTGTNFIAHE
jgi:hypothetical protein